MRVILAAFLLFTFSCAYYKETTKVRSEVPKLNLEELVERARCGSNPTYFELHMPKSNLIYDSVIQFFKDYKKVLLKRDVFDICISNGNVYYLGKNLLGSFLTNTCTSILVGNDSRKIVCSGNIVGVIGEKTVTFYDFRECGETVKYRRNLSHVFFSYPFILFYQKNLFKLYRYGEKDPCSAGEVEDDIITGGILGRNIVLVFRSGLCRIMDEKGKVISEVMTKPFIKAKIYQDSIIGMDRKGFLFFLKTSHNGSSLVVRSKKGPYKRCVFSKGLPCAYCDGFIIGENYEKEWKLDIDSFGYIHENLLLGLKYGNLYAYTPEKTYYRKIILKKPVLKACMCNGGIAILDLDGRIRFYKDGSIKELKKLTCEEKLRIEKGLVVRGNTPLMKVADVVNANKSWIMLRRVIGEDIYYFFEKNKKEVNSRHHE